MFLRDCAREGEVLKKVLSKRVFACSPIVPITYYERERKLAR